MPRRLSLVRLGTVRCQSIYIVKPPEVGQLDRGGDELTKAGNARGITGEPPPPTFQMMPAMLMPAYFLHQQPLSIPLLLLQRLKP